MADAAGEQATGQSGEPLAEAENAESQNTPAGEQPQAQEAAAASQGELAAVGPLSEDEVTAIRRGYAQAAEDGATMLQLGALVNGDARADVPITIPLGMLNRHGLIAGATGTGKTKTLQVLAEQVAAHGVPVFAADIKGDLSGIATVGTPNEKLLARTEAIGQSWEPPTAQTEY